MISNCTLSQVEFYLERILKRRNFARRRADALKDYAVALKKDASVSALAQHLAQDVQRIQRKLDVGRGIHERLLVSPWAATEVSLIHLLHLFV